MHEILILGAGKIGSLIAGLLAESGDYRVQLADSKPGAADEVAAAHGLDTILPFVLDATSMEQLVKHVKTNKPIAVISSLPYFCNVAVAEMARAEGLHYFDLTEDVSVTEAVRSISEGADQVFAPQCGLAPGFISIAAHELIKHFDSLRSVKLRVGALPQHPNNVLKYSLTWSTDGVINEYGNLCNAIVNGEEVDVLPLEGLERIEIDSQRYEAFNTSGGLGSLAETYGDEAARWFRLAAEQNFAQAQYNLAELYETGNGVPRNLELAYVWFKLAGTQKYADARKRKRRALGKQSS